MSGTGELKTQDASMRPLQGTPTPAPQTIVFFDFARGVAAQAVVLGHALNIFLPGIFMVPGRRVFYMQSFAVVIFFVLSGYLITSAVLKKRSQAGFTFRSYLLDRVARVIFPLVPALVLIVVVDLLVFNGSKRLPFISIDLSSQAIAANFLMLFNHPLLQEAAIRTPWKWIDVGPVGTGAPLWSVVAEWWIYVAFGILALVVLEGRRLGFVRGCALVFAIAVPLGYMAHGSYESLAWIIGMLYAVGAERLRALPRSFHAWMAALGAAAFWAGLYYTGQNLHAAVTVGSASVAFCHLYFALEGRKRLRSVAGGEVASGRLGGGPRAIFHRGSTFLSSFSYSLYLIHFSVITYLWFYLHGVLPAWQLILLSVVVCNVLAYAFYFMVERHFHKVGKVLKRHLLPRRGQAQV